MNAHFLCENLRPTPGRTRNAHAQHTQAQTHNKPGLWYRRTISNNSATRQHAHADTLPRFAVAGVTDCECTHTLRRGCTSDHGVCSVCTVTQIRDAHHTSWLHTFTYITTGTATATSDTSSRHLPSRSHARARADTQHMHNYARATLTSAMDSQANGIT